jgi:hypothetical protein
VELAERKKNKVHEREISIEEFLRPVEYGERKRDKGQA